MYVESLACVRVKRGESERFRIYSEVRKGCIMFLWLFNVYMDEVMKKVKMGMGRREMIFMEDVVSRRSEYLGAIVGLFVEVCRRTGLKLNSGKNKVMVMNGEEGSECEVYV